ncbi:MAG: cytochrome c [Balneolaceae bacterium]|nr:MAG: cytochrome c [Balneolaceae bacterium]
MTKNSESIIGMGWIVVMNTRLNHMTKNSDPIMKKTKTFLPLLLSFFVLAMFTFQACGGSEDESAISEDIEMELYPDSDLTPFQQVHGIGPITERIEISDDIDQEMVMRGRVIYEQKCEMCHQLDNRRIGPSLGDIVDRRSPEFVMNFILNPGEMVRNHPVGQDLLAEHFTEMQYQNLSIEEARAIYEFLRDYHAGE